MKLLRMGSSDGGGGWEASPEVDSASDLRGLDSSESELSLLEEEVPVVVVVVV